MSEPSVVQSIKEQFLRDLLFAAGRDDALDGLSPDPLLGSPEEEREYSEGYKVGLADLASTQEGLANMATLAIETGTYDVMPDDE